MLHPHPLPLRRTGYCRPPGTTRAMNWTFIEAKASAERTGSTLRQMQVADFCSASKVVIVAGKGGVGKTSVSAALARMAADHGLSVLLIELEGRPALAEAFGASQPLAYQDATLYERGAGKVIARWLTPDSALLEYLGDHGLERVSRRLVSAGVLDVVATAIPGIRDVLVLGKVKQLERNGVADLIVLDAPATGHAVTFLTSASGLLDAARTGPIRTQAAEVLQMLSDPARCRVLLVTVPEEMPVSETIEAAFRLEDQAGVQLGPVMVNRLEPAQPGLAMSAAEAARAAGIRLGEVELAELEASRQFALRRFELQETQLERLRRELPLPQLRIPALVAPSIGPSELAMLAADLAETVERLGAFQ
jgi:anion-transporting  ArsA/GET3 family ATPase